jgi:small subunit ribosomal protein S1
MSDPNPTSEETTTPAAPAPNAEQPAATSAAPAAPAAPAAAGIIPGSAPAAGPGSSPAEAPAPKALAPAPSNWSSPTDWTPAPPKPSPAPAPKTEAPATPKPPVRLTWGRPELAPGYVDPAEAAGEAQSGMRPAPGSGLEARRRVARPAPSPTAARDRERDEDKDVDDALERVMAQAAAPPTEKPLKRQWDDELEAELEAAMSGFDGGSITLGSPKKPAAERPPGARQDRGQEEGKSGTRTGKVISVRGKSIFVDLGGKSEGLLDVAQLEGQPLPEVGSDIEVVVDHFDRSEGILLLRLKGAAVEADWTNLRKGLVVEARVTKVNKGGLDVDVDGIRGFLPISQIELGRVEDASIYLNQKFKVVVTEANQREKNLVVSRRDLLEQERAELREKTWAELAEGQIREGTVRSIKDFGAFVDLGGVDGLLPIAEMSWFRVKKVEDVLKLGDKVKVQVLKIDPVARKLSLGLRQLTPSPWETVEQRFQRGAMVKGKVTRLMEFGAFVELEPGIEGLLHVTALSPNRVRRVSDIVKPEQEVEVRILKVEPDEKRISLSLLPAPKLGDKVAPVEEEEEDDTPPAPKPERKVPLKGGLGGGPLF